MAGIRGQPRWSHEGGKTRLKPVPCSWRATGTRRLLFAERRSPAGGRPGQDFRRCEVWPIVQRAIFDASCIALNHVGAFRQNSVVPSKFRAMTESSGKRRQGTEEMDPPYLLAWKHLTRCSRTSCCTKGMPSHGRGHWFDPSIAHSWRARISGPPLYFVAHMTASKRWLPLDAASWLVYRMCTGSQGCITMKSWTRSPRPSVGSTGMTSGPRRSRAGGSRRPSASCSGRRRRSTRPSARRCRACPR
jgi:hypothetical protein